MPSKQFHSTKQTLNNNSQNRPNANLEPLSVDDQTPHWQPVDCFLRPSASESSSQTHSHTNDQVFETEYGTTGANTCSQLLLQNAGHGNSSDTSQTLPENPADTHCKLPHIQLEYYQQSTLASTTPQHMNDIRTCCCCFRNCSYG